ncbi:hypothetical protein Tco_1419299 [Tanacetum coccineum]
MYNHEDEGFDYYPPLNDDEVCHDNLVPRSCHLENKGMNDAAKVAEGMNDVVEGMNDAARVGHNMEVDSIEGRNDAAKCVNIDEEVLARQKKLDKGKHAMTEDDIVTTKKKKNVCRGNCISIRENDNPVSSNNESDSEGNIDEYSHVYSKSDIDESDKSFDYLSNGEDEVIKLRKRKIEFKQSTYELDDQEGPNEVEQGTPNDVEKYVDEDDNGLGLSPLVREHEKYIEALLRKLKGVGNTKSVGHFQVVTGLSS